MSKKAVTKPYFIAGLLIMKEEIPTAQTLMSSMPKFSILPQLLGCPH